MRILLGPLNPRGNRAVVGDLVGLDVLCFDRQGADIAFDPATESLEVLWSRLPEGWSPGCLIWWSPEYSLLPEGIERCPVPSIAVLGDWNLSLWTTLPLLEAFDWVVTDRLGVQALGPQLPVPVDYWPAFSFDPAIHHRRPLERDIDVLFVGNMNHEVQAERAPWLARIARLGDRHRVVLAGGVYGDAYGELLSRAKIVWNRSIRGELNMRAYEAPACGALLLMEEENLEVRDLFADGVSCALYSADTLAPTIERYLGNPEWRTRVAEMGWRRVLPETYRRRLERLIADAGQLAIGPRPFGQLPPWRRDYWLALHAMASPDAKRVAAASRHLTRAFERSPDPWATTAAMGALAIIAATEADADAQPRWLASAARLLSVALHGRPDDVVTRVSLGWVSAVRGDVSRARTEWTAALEHLRNAGRAPVDRLPMPFPFDAFRVAWERAAVEPDPDTRGARFASLLRARVAADLGRVEADAGREVVLWTESVEAAPGIAENVRELAAALVAAGETEAAALAYAQALEANPFDWRARVGAATLAIDGGHRRRFDALVGEGRLLAATGDNDEAMAALDRLAGTPASVGSPR